MAQPVRLLKEALARGLPVILTCRGGEAAEADLARLALAALAAAPPPKSPLPAPRAWQASTPLLCYDAGSLWERLHLKRPFCAYLLLDGSITFSKAPRELRNAAFDVPLGRLLLCSSAPRSMPASASHEQGRRSLCHSGHIVHTAERVASLKSAGSETDAEPSAASILAHARESARLVFPALELPWIIEGANECEHYRHHFWGESSAAAPPSRLCQDEKPTPSAVVALRTGGNSWTKLSVRKPRSASSTGEANT